MRRRRIIRQQNPKKIKTGIVIKGENPKRNLLKNDRAGVYPIIVKEYTITQEPGSFGTPDSLEVFRLLSLAKVLLHKGELEHARSVYDQIARLYQDLPPEEKDIAHTEITAVFKPKPDTNSNIDQLITEFEKSVQKKDMMKSSKVYEKIQEEYESLPPEHKDRYYSRIISLYNNAVLGSA